MGLPGNTAKDAAKKSLRPQAGRTVLVGRDISDLRRAQRVGCSWNVALAGSLTLVVAIFGDGSSRDRALAPIKRISRTARAMSEGDLHARIASRTDSELEQVASTLNEAFDRLRLVVEQDGGSLPMPLTSCAHPCRCCAPKPSGRSIASHPQQYKDALTVGRRAGLRMQDIVERLLALVRAEVARDVQEPAPVAMRTLIDDVVTGLRRWRRPAACA